MKFSVLSAILANALFFTAYSVNAEEVGGLSGGLKNQIEQALDQYKPIHHDHTVREFNCRPGDPGESVQIKSALDSYKLSRRGGSADLFLVDIKMEVSCYIYRRQMACPGNTPISENESPTAPPKRTVTTELVIYQGEIIKLGELKFLPSELSGSAKQCGMSLSSLKRTLGIH